MAEKIRPSANVGVADSFAASRRPSEQNEAPTQQQWSTDYLDERALGAFLALTIFGGAGVAALSAEAWLRALGIAAPILVALLIALLHWRNHRRLARLRDAQLDEHRRIIAAGAESDG